MKIIDYVIYCCCCFNDSCEDIDCELFNVKIDINVSLL